MTEKKYRYFLMDLDGTISNPKEGVTKAVAYALKSYGIIENDLNKLCKFIGPPLTDSFRQYYGFAEEQSQEAILKFREYYTDRGIYENFLYDGIENLLMSVTLAGGKVILATSKPEIYAKKILKRFSIHKYFSFVAGSNMDLTRYKKGEVIEYALKSMNIDAKEAVMIGDREHDITGAKENNLDSIGVLYGFGDKEELTVAGVSYTSNTIDSLTKLLLSMIE